MGRFQYIPLEFQRITEKNDLDKIDIGEPRELLIEKSSDTLYVLDDFRVPITPKYESAKERKNFQPFVTESDQITDHMLEDYDSYLECYEIGTEDSFQELDSLEVMSEGLKDRINEIKDSMQNDLTKINESVNKHDSDIKGILSSLDTRVANVPTLLTSYRGYINNYKTVFPLLDSAINKINSNLATKLRNFQLPQYTILIHARQKVTSFYKYVGFFRWLTNSGFSGNSTKNIRYYPANTGARHDYYAPSPELPMSACGGNFDAMYRIDGECIGNGKSLDELASILANSGFWATDGDKHIYVTPTGAANGFSMSHEWLDGVCTPDDEFSTYYNRGSIGVQGGKRYYISTTNRANRYGRKVKCSYQWGFNYWIHYIKGLLVNY